MTALVLSPLTPPPSGRYPGALTQLIVQCGRRDEAAFGRFFDAALPVVGSITARSAHPFADTDEAVVAAFLHMWRRAPSFDPSTCGALAWVSDQVLASNAQHERLRAESVATQVPSTAPLRPSGAANPNAQAPLTQREGEIIQLIAQGHSNREIAATLFLSINSVKTYIRQAYSKIGVSRRSQAVIWELNRAQRA